MNSGLSKKGSLGRLAAIFAAILLVSSGLCGVNALLMFRFVPMSGYTPPTHAQNVVGSLLVATGVIELVGIAFGLVSCVTVAMMVLFNSFFGTRNGEKQ